MCQLKCIHGLYFHQKKCQKQCYLLSLKFYILKKNRTSSSPISVKIQTVDQ